ncbi:FAD-dependent monooxygenase [Streptomyces sp. NPDC026206]|uniref:FAD-dependent monooxygenase n=1 Tax=Streptomyces sp. NPDC026206 TaxID=3157089 RepID=UPI0034001B59
MRCSVLPDSVQVAIVGAGPVGLQLAGEISLRGVGCVVLERDAHTDQATRALVLHARTLEYFDMRGIADPIVAAGHRYGHYPLGTVRARAPFSILDSPFAYALALPQYRTESVLEAHARANGALLVRGAEVTGVRHEPGSTVLTVHHAGRVRRLRAAYVAGCDGARSIVRRIAGIPASRSVYPYDVTSIDARLELDPQQPWSWCGRDGMAILLPFGDGRWRVILYDYRPSGTKGAEPAAGTDRAAALLRLITGSDLTLRDVQWISRYRCERRHATRYRHHRVVLAGDAAHVHPPTGGQGLNTGIADAMNLGWRLALAATDPRHDPLLDVYADERRQAAVRVLRLTGAMLHFNAAPSWWAHAVRAVAFPAARLPTVRRRLAAILAGLSQPPAQANGRLHSGQRVPDLPLSGVPVQGAPGRLFEALRPGHHVHLTPACGTPDPRATGMSHPMVTARSEACRRPCIVRPDGHLL